jgi:hypothetical protein
MGLPLLGSLHFLGPLKLARGHQLKLDYACEGHLEEYEDH